MKTLILTLIAFATTAHADVQAQVNGVVEIYNTTLQPIVMNFAPVEDFSEGSSTHLLHAQMPGRPVYPAFFVDTNEDGEVWVIYTRANVEGLSAKKKRLFKGYCYQFVSKDGYSVKLENAPCLLPDGGEYDEKKPKQK